MHLTLQTDYALRALIYLATLDEGGAADEGSEGKWPTVRQMAEAYDVSQPHLVKVVQQLAHAGFVVTRPGRGGGVRLAQRPADIVVGDVVRAMEPNLAPVVCMDREAERKCVIAPACGLIAPLRDATEQFLAVLDNYTVADCIRKREGLKDLLHIGDRPRRAAH